MIINDAEPGTAGFTLVSADGSRKLSMAVPDELREDFRAHLAAHGFHVPEGAARSIVADVIVAAAENPAAWTALGGTVMAFLHRNRGKAHQIHIEGKSATIEGYSAKEAEKLVAALLGSGQDAAAKSDRAR